MFKVYRFYMAYKDVYEEIPSAVPGAKPRYKKTGKLEEVHRVEYGPLGDKRTIVDASIKELSGVNPHADPMANPTQFMALKRWEIIEPLYKNWLKGIQPTDEGYPLAAWSGTQPVQVEALAIRGVTTVEQLATLNDSHIERFGVPHLRILIQNAKRFLAAQDHTAVVEELAAKDAEIRDLREQVGELADFINQVRRGEISLGGEGGRLERTENLPEDNEPITDDLPAGVQTEEADVGTTAAVPAPGPLKRGKAAVTAA